MWTRDKEAEAIRTLKDEGGVLPKSQWYYHIRRQFELTVFGDVDRVRRKGGGIMVLTEDMWNIVRDIHVACGHKGETKTHKKVREQYANITMVTTKDVIKKCDRCAEKAKKKSGQNVVVRPILSSVLNDRGQVDLIDYRTPRRRI